MSARYRVACLVSHPIQYQAPMFRHLSASPEIDLTVLFISELSTREYRDAGFGVSLKWDIPLLDGYQHQFLPALGRSDRLSFWRPFTRRIVPFIKGCQFDALWIHGYAHQTILRAILAAKSSGIRVMLRGESHLGLETGSPLKRSIKRRVLKRLFSAVDAYLTIGEANREFYLDYGIAPDRLFAMPYAVDNVFFRERAAAAGRSRDRFRRELGLQPGRPIILFTSKFQARKRACDLLEAYARIARSGFHPKPYLLMIGDGAERGALEARAREIDAESIRFQGFMNQTELPRFYDLCDVFVLPSDREPWGLVLNEVMNAAKPIIASDAVGAARDLVLDGENGFVFPVGNSVALARCLERVLSSPEHAASMGARSLEIVSRYSFEADRDGLLTALDAMKPAERSTSRDADQ